MDLKVGNLPVTGVYVGSTPVPEVYVGSKLVWSATVQITLGTGFEARDQFRAALTERGLDHATITEVPFEIELVGTGSAQNMFESCWELESVPNLDTSGVTNMSSMFAYCQSITHVPDMDTSNVTDMSNMFSTCSELTHAPAMDTSNVTDMYAMFSGCGLLTHVPDMDTSKVTNMNYMFFVCTSLTDGNVRLIGRNPYVSTDSMISVTGLTREPWYRADGTPLEVVQITLGNNMKAQRELRDILSARGLNYRNVTELPFDIELVGTGSAEYMFDGFTALKSVPPMNTTQVTNMERMFSGCKALTTVPAMNTSQVTSMYYMFNDCSALTSVPAMDTSKVTNAQYMFRNCSALTDENVRLIGKNPNVDTSFMIDRSGLTKEPFYATDRLPNPPAPRVVTIRKHSTNYNQWDTNSATGDVSLIQEWAGSNGVRFAAYVTCNETVYSSDSFQMQKPGAVLRSGAGITPYIPSVYTFTEVI